MLWEHDGKLTPVASQLTSERLLLKRHHLDQIHLPTPFLPPWTLGTSLHLNDQIPAITDMAKTRKLESDQEKLSSNHEAGIYSG